MSLLRKMFPSLFPAAPAPSPMPEPTASPAADTLAVGQIIDAGGWTGDLSADWTFEGTRIDYKGRNNQPLTSPPIAAGEGELVKVAAVIACDAPWGTRAALAGVGITAHYADGRAIDSPRCELINSGVFRTELRMPPRTDHYRIQLIPLNTTQSGSYTGDPNIDGLPLRARFVNLCHPAD